VPVLSVTRTDAVSPVSITSSAGPSVAKAAGRSVKQEMRRTKSVADGHFLSDFDIVRFPCGRGPPVEKVSWILL